MAAAVSACRCTGCPSTARIVSKKTRPVWCACMTWPKAFKEKPAQGRSSSRPARWTQTAVSTPQLTIRLQKTNSARAFLWHVGDSIVLPFLSTKRHCVYAAEALCTLRQTRAPQHQPRGHGHTVHNHGGVRCERTCSIGALYC